MNPPNPPFSRLLLATECSDFDRAAEKMAFTLAQHCQLPLAAVLPMVSNPEFEALAPEVAMQIDAEAAHKLARLRQQAADANIRMNVAVRRGEEAYFAIVEEARAIACDMLIIRRRGKRGFLANVLIGEMVTRVVSHAPCHVLIVPQESAVWSQGIMVVLNTGDTAASSAHHAFALQNATAIAAQCGLPLHIVRASSYGDVLRARDNNRSDLIVMQHSTLAQQVIGRSDYPVLVLRHESPTAV
ncbi:MAG: hypothetical protein RLZZ495_609 [Pseudomonadota bacterium]|mgnify:CR=1 FL=1|jgi:nucleotide-binding universal stress UspA family protein